MSGHSSFLNSISTALLRDLNCPSVQDFCCARAATDALATHITFPGCFPMHKKFLFFSSLGGFSGVAFGAFGAHGLRAILDESMMTVYQTGVHYHLFHALGLGLIALLARQYPRSALLRWAGWLMLAGIVIFSGSLYLLSISGIKWLGVITPIGGSALLLAWLLLTVFAARYADDPVLELDR